MNTAYLLMGGNLGNVPEIFEKAIMLLRQELGVVQKKSSLYKTKAWGLENQPDFLNQALEIKTGKTAQETLKIVLNIEQILGRIRKEKFGARSIDIDILLFNEAIIDEENLKVPHPFLHQRNFAMQPLAELAPSAFHPVLKKDIQTLLKESEDVLDVIKLENHRYAELM